MYNKLLRKHMASKPATDPVYKEKRVPKGPIKFDKVTLTEEQKLVASKIKENKITVLTGLPGSSKTFTACYVGLQMLLRKDVEKIVIIRPTLATENIGYLPGDLGEKMCGYVMPVISNMYDIYDKDKIDKYMSDGLIEIIPLQFARGITFRNSFVIVEEAMNLTDHQTKTVLERFGKDSKMVITGDKKQTDFKNKSDSGFDKLVKIKANKFEVVVMTENFRDEIILELLKYYEV